MNDFIQLPRSMLKSIPSVVHRGIFVCLLERADENGQLSISIRGFADEMKVSYQTVRSALSKLLDNAIINAIATQRLTQITICDFDSYIATPRKSQRKVNAPSNAIINKTKSAKFTPPTDEEVAAYVAEKGYHFNPEQFVPFYQSKDWMIGKNPMKDWRAACRTWELEWKKKHGERFYYEIQSNITTDNAASRKAQRDRGLSFATEIVARSENLLGLYNGGGTDPHACQDKKRSLRD